MVSPDLFHRLECYDKALEIDDKNADSWSSKGYIRYMMGWANEAIQCYDRALEIDEKYSMAWNNKGAAIHNSNGEEVGEISSNEVEATLTGFTPGEPDTVTLRSTNVRTNDCLNAENNPLPVTGINIQGFCGINLRPEDPSFLTTEGGGQINLFKGHFNAHSRSRH